MTDLPEEFVMRRKRKRALSMQYEEMDFSNDTSILFTSETQESKDMVISGSLIPEIVTLGHEEVSSPIRNTSDDIVVEYTKAPRINKKCAPKIEVENSETVVTVERFLRLSTEKPSRRYGKRKKRAKDIKSSGVTECDAYICANPSSDPVLPWSSSPVHAKLARPSGSRKGKQFQTSCAERLMRANVLSHGEPGGTLELQRGGTVPPLQFASFQETPMSRIGRLGESTPDPVQMSNRNKDTKMYQPYGPSQQKPITSFKPQLPMSTWCSSQPHSLANNILRTTKAHKVPRPQVTIQISTRTPLVFVPYEQTQPVVKSSNTTKSSSGKGLQTSRPPLELTETTTKYASTSTYFNEAELEALSQPPPRKRARYSSASIAPISTKERSRASAASHASIQQKPRVHEPQAKSADVSWPVEKIPVQRAGALTKANRSVSSNQSTCAESQESNISVPVAPKKPMRPLASYMDSFMETARNVQILQATNAAEGKKSHSKQAFKGERSSLRMERGGLVTPHTGHPTASLRIETRYRGQTQKSFPSKHLDDLEYLFGPEEGVADISLFSDDLFSGSDNK
ncbi:hypothetical protein SERLA73DRAFT_73248 [Serpula lacrymans var. lacrymans S7.3]|uniref:Uncharacterized protein n=1 Tax=Serpula lacrymans var. lacrymans (strain S7.3) TaxID=936435 RepID=F8PXL9_SERL3|nr:hypothetical protein SERLA73DRAFT_73248 [Serpula lacrymans var. lacrymans S7.3]